MGGDTSRDGHVFVRDVKQDVVSRCDRLPESEGVKGGIVCHGYFDIEKLIFFGHKEHDGRGEACEEERDDGKKRDRVLLLEKKLPFQLLIVRLS